MAKTILIADDEPDMADFLATALTADGFAVESVGSANAIVEKLKTLAPHLQGAGVDAIPTRVKEMLK